MTRRKLNLDLDPLNPKQLKWTTLESGYRDGVPYVLKEASFETPALRSSVARALPAASSLARARLLTPVIDPSSSSSSSSSPALYVHLAGTGDHGFDRRLRLGAPLLVPPGKGKGRGRGFEKSRAAATLGEEEGEERRRRQQLSSLPSSSEALSGGIATLALESPFYGSRRPPWQSGARLASVSDLIALGRATIEEALALLRWAAAFGYGRAGADYSSDSSTVTSGGGLGVTGLSMGGVHAAMVAALAPGPLAAVPMLAPRSAAAAFCRGALWRATAWEPLLAANGGNKEETVVLEALLAAAAAAPPGSAAARVSEALAAKGWPLSTSSSSSSSSSSSPTSSFSSSAAAAMAAAKAREALEHVLETYTDVTR